MTYRGRNDLSSKVIQQDVLQARKGVTNRRVIVTDYLGGDLLHQADT